MAVVTHWVKCAAVENPYWSRTCRQRGEATAVFRIKAQRQLAVHSPVAVQEEADIVAAGVAFREEHAVDVMAVVARKLPGLVIAL